MAARRQSVELTDREKGLQDERREQKKEREQKFAEDDRRKLVEELGEKPECAAAVLKRHLEIQLEEHNKLENTIQEWKKAKSRQETIRRELEELNETVEETNGQNISGVEKVAESDKPQYSASSSSSVQGIRLSKGNQLPSGERESLLPPNSENLLPFHRKVAQREEVLEIDLQRVTQEKEELKRRLQDEAAELLEGCKVPQSLVADIHLQQVLKVLDKKELDAVYEYRIKHDPDSIKELHRAEARKTAGFWGALSEGRLKLEEEKIANKKGSAKEDILYVDESLGVPELPYTYQEIKRLLDIEKNPVYVKALQEWSRQEVLFSSRVERKKKKVANLKNEIYQLIGFFSVFQGVVLTAVAQSSLLHCNNKWSPISLSVLASVVSIFGVVQKLKQIKDFQTTIDSDEKPFLIAVKRGHKLRALGTENFSFATSVNENAINTGQSKHLVRWVYYFLVTVTLVAFGVLFPVSHWRILCFSNAPAPAPAP